MKVFLAEMAGLDFHGLFSAVDWQYWSQWINDFNRWKGPYLWII